MTLERVVSGFADPANVPLFEGNFLPAEGCGRPGAIRFLLPEGYHGACAGIGLSRRNPNKMARP